MLALWLENRSLRVRRDVPDPQPAPGDALIPVLQAGICNTDLELTRGYYPFTGILGHEFVGEVVEAAARPELVGKRVVGEINVTCGACHACLAGRRTHCERRQVLGIQGRNGAFAEYVVLPVGNLHEVAPSSPMMKQGSPSRWRPPWRSGSRSGSGRATACWCSERGSSAAWWLR